MSSDADPGLAARVQRALGELRFLGKDSLASALADYEPEVAAAAQHQLAAEEAAFAQLLGLEGEELAQAIAALDPLTAEGVRLRRAALVDGDPMLGGHKAEIKVKHRALKVLMPQNALYLLKNRDANGVRRTKRIG